MNLSPGNYHLTCPRERRRNLKFRAFVIRRCRENAEYRRAVMEMCRTDIVFWINTFVWQFNPNAIGKWSTKNGPFIVHGFQDDAVRTILEAVDDRSDCIIEKSREMGASWLCLIVMTWFFLFHEGSTFLCISRNEKAVDDGTSKCLFWKIDYILAHLPEWMGEVKNKNNEGQIYRKEYHFRNERLMTEITGEASTSKAGVGGRATAIFLDEFSQIREAWQVLDRTTNTSGCRIFNGTHMGTNTAFFELCVKAGRSKHLKKIVMHWSLHPDKTRGLYRWDAERKRVNYLDYGYVYDADFNPVCDGSPAGGPFPGMRSPWYDKICEKMGNQRGIAADLDINPSGSVEQVFNQLLIAELKRTYCREPWSADLEYDPQSGVPKRLWEEEGGKVKLWQRLSYDGLPPVGRYVCGNDIATGTGATPSCCTIANATTGEKVAEFIDSHIEPKEFTYFVIALCLLFKDEDGRPAKLAWEIPGPGNTFTKHALELKYPNIWFRHTNDIRKSLSDEPGWNNHPEPMKSLITEYKNALRDRKFLNRSEFALSECMAFMYGPDGYVYHTGWKDPKDPSGARINHGDRVVADAIAWKLIDEGGRLVVVNPNEAPAETPSKPGGLAWRRQLDRLGRKEKDWC